MKPHAGFGTGVGFNEVNALLILRVARAEYHAFAHPKTHLAGGEVGDHDDEFPDDVFGLIESTDAGEDLTDAAFADIEHQPQEFVASFDGRAFDDFGNSEVGLHEIIDRADGGNRFAAREVRFVLLFFGGRRGGLGAGNEGIEVLLKVHAAHQVLVLLNGVRARQGLVHRVPRLFTAVKERFDAFGSVRENGL